jgi:hypothetical protein
MLLRLIKFSALFVGSYEGYSKPWNFFLDCHSCSPSGEVNPAQTLLDSLNIYRLCDPEIMIMDINPCVKVTLVQKNTCSLKKWGVGGNLGFFH